MILLAFLIGASTPTVVVTGFDPQINPACVVGGGGINDVCVPDYTETVRPSVTWTNALKQLRMQSQALPGKLSDYELDHFIPLALCGAPRAGQNLWMEPIKEAKLKDKDEDRLHRAVCKGRMTLEAAQDYIRTHWKIYDAGVK